MVPQVGGVTESTIRFLETEKPKTRELPIGQAVLAQFGNHPLGVSKSMQNNSSAVASLKSIFADTYALYLKTQGYHWNVTGAHFTSFHALFESQYESLSKAVDELAERIRVLGEFAPCTFNDLSSLSSIPPAKDSLSANAMVKDLLESHNILSERIDNVISSNANDEGTVAVLSERLTEHQKTAWMLRASLES